MIQKQDMMLPWAMTTGIDLASMQCSLRGRKAGLKDPFEFNDALSKCWALQRCLGIAERDWLIATTPRNANVLLSLSHHHKTKFEINRNPDDGGVEDINRTEQCQSQDLPESRTSARPAKGVTSVEGQQLTISQTYRKLEELELEKGQPARRRAKSKEHRDEVGPLS